MELEATPRHGVAKGEGDLRLRKTIPSEAFGGKPMNRRHAICAGLCATIALISGFLYVTFRDNDYYDPRYLPGGWSADDDDDDDDNPIVRLKAELHRLTAAEAKPPLWRDPPARPGAAAAEQDRSLCRLIHGESRGRQYVWLHGPSWL